MTIISGIRNRRSEMGSLWRNPAIAFSVFGQLANGVTGPLVALVISRRISTDSQGFYYLASSLAILQTIVELGMNQCIVNIASHYMFGETNVSRKAIQASNPECLRNLRKIFQLSVRWYAVAACVFSLLLTVTGFAFASNYAGNSWSKWAIFAVGQALWLMVSPLTSLMEGMQRVAEAAILKTSGAIARSVILLCLFLGNAGDWSLPWASLLSGGGLLIVIVVLWRHSFAELSKREDGLYVFYRDEVARYQRAVSLTWMASLFLFGVIQPILSRSVGLTVAGLFGMSWSLVQGVRSLAAAVVTASVPSLGKLIAEGRKAEARRIWRERSYAAQAMYAISVSALIVVIFTSERVGLRPFRVLPVREFCALALACYLHLVSAQCGEFMRCFRTDPTARWVLILSVGFSATCWFLAPRIGVYGVILPFGVAMSVLLWFTYATMTTVYEAAEVGS